MSAPLPPLIGMVSPSSRAELARRSEAEQDALSDYLVKPVTAAMLRDSIAKARTGNQGLRNRVRRGGVVERRLIGMRILVVEDNMINQQVAEELLNSQGALVSIASNGQQGVEAVSASKPPFDLVLMDLQMPVMDGLTAARTIRQELQFSHLPIIAMTANAMTTDKAACLAAGMNDHVGKPFDLTELVQTIVKHTAWVAVPTSGHPSAGVSADLLGALDGFAWPACLDGVHAVARLGGNVALYVRSLKSYLVQLPQHADTVSQLIAQGEMEVARRDLHSLKGTSATLGVLAIAALAAQCEKLTMLATADRLTEQLTELQALVSSLLPSLMQALAALEARLGTTTPPGGTSDQAGDPLAEHRGALGLLLNHLKASDMAAMEVHADLRQRVDTSLAGLFEPLDAAMADLQFDQAAVHCEALLAPPPT
ncbi:MAG: hypothetical protein CFE44_19960 [Burkholderiales bacterium PBB4]|nr:MAG: hypothetical protein CFE44_19960 [Burkholderiales bacterium PBB4]